MALIDRLNAIGDAIREKNGTTERIALVDMPQAILNIISCDGGTLEKTLIPETSIDLAYNGETEGWITGMTTLENFPKLTTEQTYSLTIDDETPIDITLTAMKGVLIVGNIAMGEAGDNGEDYFLMLNEESSTLNLGIRSDMEGTHTVKLNIITADVVSAIATLIDNSGVLEDTEGSVTQKVEELIDKAKSGGSASIDENGIVTFGENTTINENGIVSL